MVADASNEDRVSNPLDSFTDRESILAAFRMRLDSMQAGDHSIKLSFQRANPCQMLSGEDSFSRI